MSDSFDAHEQPTQPRGTAKTHTSRWRSVANAALERGFGRLSDGDFDLGPATAEESGTRIVAALLEAGPRTPAPTPIAAPEVRRDLGPRGTVRLDIAGLRGPTCTMRMAPPRVRRHARLSRGQWLTMSSFALLALALGFAIVRANPPEATVAPISASEAAEPLPLPPVGPSDPPEPAPDFVLSTDPPAAAPAKATKRHGPTWRAPARTHRTHTGSNVF